MDHLLLVIVQILALTTPLLSRRLPNGDFDHIATADHIVAPEHHTDHGPTAVTQEHHMNHGPTAVNQEHHTDHGATANDRTELKFSAESAEEHVANAEPASHESAQRYRFLPTPNIATPILSALVLPTTYPAREIPYPAPHPLVPVIRDHKDYDWPRRKHIRKIKVNDDGTLWTKFPNMKHLVEIVPIKHKSNTKGKALAYIVPKSHRIKNKLKKRKRISGIVVDRNMPDFSEVLESNEENSVMDISESKSSSESDSIELTSSDHENKSAQDVSEIERTPEKAVSNDDDDPNSEVTINNKLNNIVSHYNQHNDDDLNSLIHEVLPDNEVDPEYHVHYIIHKKHRPNNNHNSTENNTYHHENNIIHINYEPNENDVNSKQIHIYPQSDNLEFIDENDNHQLNQEKFNAYIDHSHKINEHVIEPHHNTFHSDHELKHDVTESTHHSDTDVHRNHSSEDLGYIKIGDNDESILIESIEQLHDLFHEAEVEPDLESYDLITESAEINNGPSRKTQVNHEEKPTHHTHVYTDSDIDNSDQSNDFINHSDDLSSINYSASLNDEAFIEESSQSADSSYSKTKDSVDSSYERQASSDSEHDSHKYNSDPSNSLESNQNDSYDTISADDLTPDQFIQGHSTSIIAATSHESASSESIETNLGLQRENRAEFSLDQLTGHDFVFTNSKKLNKKKAVRKCENDCDGHKSYTLTFLFNR